MNSIDHEVRALRAENARLRKTLRTRLFAPVRARSAVREARRLARIVAGVADFERLGI